jgi:hypothetical protein
VLQTDQLLTALCEAEVAFVVIGGMAAVAQGSSYVTADLDICYQRQPHNYQRLSQALRPFHPQLRGAPADLPFVLDAATLKAGLNFTLTTASGDLDLKGELTGLGDYENQMGQLQPRCTHYPPQHGAGQEATGAPRNIVVHEMIHVLKPTHNACFIALMDQCMPQWQFYRDQLNRLPVRHEDGLLDTMTSKRALSWANMACTGRLWRCAP